MKTATALTAASCLLNLAAFAMAEMPAGMQWSDVANNGRNMVLPARNLPDDIETAKVLWRVEPRARRRYAQPVIKDGRVYLGATADGCSDPDLAAWKRHKDGLVTCRDLESGKVLWELLIPKHSLSRCGVCSPPVVQGDRVYMLGIQEIVCLDVNGMADGNDGPFTDELALMNAAADADEQLDALKKTHGDIIWIYDFKREHNLRFEDAASGTVLVDGDLVWATTSHKLGVKDKGGSAKAPNVIVLDRETGRLVARDRVSVPHVFHGQWSSLAAGTVEGRTLVFWGDGYGVLHAFERPDGEAEQIQDLKRAWWYDCNPPRYRTHEGKPIQYSHDKRMTEKPDPPVDWAEGVDYKRIGPSEIIAAPVFHEGKVYVHLGRDDHYDYRSEGQEIAAGMIHCIDPTGSGDVTETHRVWANDKVGRSQAQVSILDDRIYLLDTHGHLFCLDKPTGRIVWTESLGSDASCRSPLLADGKLFMGTDRREFFIYKLTPSPVRLSQARLDEQIATPTAIDGVLILATPRSITAYGPGK
jgi:outer membrane protein assembly factor BamB